jgi:hypothetical protein
MADYIMDNLADLEKMYNTIRKINSIFIEIRETFKKHDALHSRDVKNHDCCIAEIRDILLDYNFKTYTNADFGSFKNEDLR